jgi:hypothetical protein
MYEKKSKRDKESGEKNRQKKRKQVIQSKRYQQCKSPLQVLHREVRSAWVGRIRD